MGGLVDDLLRLLEAVVLLGLELLDLLDDRRGPISLLDRVVTDGVNDVLHELGPLHAAVTVDVHFGKKFVTAMD